MADYMALFHNPESFEDSDLSKMRMKIKMHKMFAYGCAGGFAAIPTLMGKPLCIKRTAGMGLLGLVFGAAFANNVMGNGNVRATKYTQGVQDTIGLIDKFNFKWVSLTLNATGYGNNALSAQYHTNKISAFYKKPY